MKCPYTCWNSEHRIYGHATARAPHSAHTPLRRCDRYGIRHALESLQILTARYFHPAATIELYSRMLRVDHPHKSVRRVSDHILYSLNTYYLYVYMYLYMDYMLCTKRTTAKCLFVNVTQHLGNNHFPDNITIALLNRWR